MTFRRDLSKNEKEISYHSDPETCESVRVVYSKRSSFFPPFKFKEYLSTIITPLPNPNFSAEYQLKKFGRRAREMLSDMNNSGLRTLVSRIGNLYDVRILGIPADSKDKVKEKDSIKILNEFNKTIGLNVEIHLDSFQNQTEI